MPPNDWRALALGRAPQVPEFLEEEQEGFLARLGSLVGLDQSSLASRMQDLGRMRARLPDGTAPGPPQPGSPEFDAAVDVAGAFDFLGPIKAYHGSPHMFDRFDLGRIGTGEGAQAYGHGLYFAENPAVAKEYQRDLEGIGARILKTGQEEKTWKELNDVEKHAFREVLDAPGGIDEAISGLEDIQANPQNYPAGESTRKIWADALPVLRQWKDQGAKFTPGGNAYTVNLAVEPEDLLDWDLPLSQQPEKVRKALDAVAALKPTPPPPGGMVARSLAGKTPLMETDPTGRQIYENLSARTAGAGTRPDAPDLASTALRAAGIPGLRYLDEGSRTAGEGTRNMVLFDETLAEILERNGMPVTGK